MKTRRTQIMTVLVMPVTAALQSATQTRLADRRKNYSCLGIGTAEPKKVQENEATHAAIVFIF